MHRKKFGNFPAGTLLPCSGDFWYIPAGSSVFSVSFLQVPSGSSDRNLRAGYSDFLLKPHAHYYVQRVPYIELTTADVKDNCRFIE